jgi:crotonobetainyl-CoA:carnitine CoA-transferase CaiB-like acyl-CoA transferase
MLARTLGGSGRRTSGGARQEGVWLPLAPNEIGPEDGRIRWPSHGLRLGRVLSGVRVLDLSRILSGPYCTMVLADLGADVVKIEAPGGDETRRWGPPFVGDTAAYYFGTNRNKNSVVLDLTTADGRDALAALLTEADVVVHNFTSRVARKLGADYKSVRAVKPDVIHLSFSGFGGHDPRRGYDLVAQALTGLMAITGEADRPAVKVGAPVSDLAAALFGAISVVSALFARTASGEGAELHVSLYDATLSLLGNQSMNWLMASEDTPRLGSEHPSITPYGAYRAADGELVIAVGSDEQFAALCDALEIGDLKHRFPRNADRVSNRDVVKSRIEEALGGRSRAVWLAVLTAAGVPTAEVRTVGEALDAPETTTVTWIDDGEDGKIPQVGGPIRVNGQLQLPFLPPPQLGEHTDEVVGGFLSDGDVEPR